MAKCKTEKQAAEIAAETAPKNEGGELVAETTNEPTAAEITATEIESEQQELPAAITLDELEAMDMDMFGYQAEPEETQRWRITDDSCADWAVRKIAEERAELNRIKELADAEISRIMEKVAAAEKRCENGTRFFTSKLLEYFDTVPHKETKTKHSYRLLSGTLSMKIGGTTMKQDDAKLLEYLKASGRDDMITVTEKPKWGEYKKTLKIVGGVAVDTITGEIVEGVVVEQKADTFTVDT